MYHTIKKPKVVIVMNDFSVGGVQKLAVDQMRLLGNEFEFVVMSLMQFSTGDFYHLIPENVRVYKLNFKGFLDFYSWIKLIKIIKKEKPQIVKTAMFFSNTILRILKPLFKYIVITAEHNTEAHRPLWQRLVNRMLSCITYTIIADSQTVADFVSMSEKISRKKFTVIYNGVELEDINRAKKTYKDSFEKIRSEIGVSLNEKMFLTVARLITQKNHVLMLSGFHKYLNKGGNGKLIIIGGGKLRSDLISLSIQLKIEKNVIFLGERQDIYKFYSVADYFILTSLREGFCISAMNGLAFGLPLISTRVAGVIEYLKDGENGYFADFSAEDVGNKMLQIYQLSDVELIEFKKRAQETALQFGVDTHAQHYRKLFNQCLHLK